MDGPLEQEANDVFVASQGGRDERLAILAIRTGRMDRPGEQEANDVHVATLARTTPVVFMSLPSVEATHTVVGALQGGQCLSMSWY
jgi:hypothetical protein